MSGKGGSGSGVISLPKGGGAVHGIGETFSSNMFTGTGSFSVPIAVPPGRSGFQPQISLVYNSGSGNGPFGFGWSLSVPGVARKTSKGIPTFGDDDVFILSGAEDLVPVGEEGRYRPRTEGLFARILHPQSDRWEVSTRDGLVSTYGGPGAVLADPENARRILAWKLSRTVDTFGNRIEYTYERDTVVDEGRSFTQTYLSEIRYVDYGAVTMGGDPPYPPAQPASAPKFLVRIRFHYENRPDPFSDHRGGFEVRTRRRCRSIAVFTEHGASTLVRTYHLEYVDDAGRGPINGASLLSRLRVEGAGHDTVPSQALPPLSFSYTDFQPCEQRFIPVTGDQLPTESLAHPDYDLVDLSGGGLPDILQMNGIAARWWKNLGGGRFDRPRTLKDVPAGFALGDPGVQLLDADGDGRADLMVTPVTMGGTPPYPPGPPVSGYFPILYGGRWDPRSFHRFDRAPSFDLRDPEVRLVDLDGDGVTDALRSGSSFECFFNDPDHGWTGTRAVERRGLDAFPNVNFSDPRVKWADMTGDGLTDIVLVNRGRVDYWPNRGRGDWGRRVSMPNAPRLPDGYDPRRVLLGDVDGDGVADLVYVDDGKITLWINKSGNGFSDPIEIHGTPRVADPDSVRLADLLGNGVAGILWSADARFPGRPWMFFLDLTGGTKPYLLHALDNGMGATTKVAYVPSTRFYLQDQACPETRWKSPLPFPVQVVARVEVIDAISKGKLATEYRYHHGYWDGVEREFRGFGRVDRRDTEVFDEYHASGLHGAGTPFQHVLRTPEQPFFSPPTETRTWFHQGPVGDRERWVESDFSEEFWSGDGTQLADFAPPRLTSRDAVRTLRGRVIRSELYAHDGNERADRPFSVTESIAGVRRVVEAGDEEPEEPIRCGGEEAEVFFPHSIAERVTQWERGSDPLTRFSFTEGFDKYGQSRAAIAIAVPRGDKPPPERGPYLATFGRTTYAQREDGARYIVDRVASVTSYEIVNDGSGSVADLVRSVRAGTASLRVVGQSFQYYDGKEFEGLRCGDLGEHGAPMCAESLVLTEDILKDVHRGGAIPHYLLHDGAGGGAAEYPAGFDPPPLAGHVYYPGGDGTKDQPPHVAGYFVKTDRRKYDYQFRSDKHGLVQFTRDPMGRETFVGYDEHRLLPIQVKDPAGLTTTAEYDYRVFQPASMTDANGNTMRFGYTPLGLVESITAPKDRPRKPSTSFEYDLTPYAESQRPLSVRTIQLVHHTGEAASGEKIERVELSDGFGRVVQVRAQAEDVAFGDPTYGGGVLPIDQADPGRHPIAGTQMDPGRPRVAVSGAQTFDNKGRVVEKYEPVFSTGWAYEPPDTLPRGQKVTFFYDAVGRGVRTLFPDGAELRVVHGIPLDLADPDRFTPSPWEAFTYDANDNAGRTHGDDTDAKGYRKHWNTPSSAVIDALGRTVLAVQQSGSDAGDRLETRSTYDIQGNVLTVTDPKGRTAFQYTYDLAKHALRTESIDAGVRRVTLDASGSPIERRDAKAALVLSTYDKAGRPSRLWARDGEGEAVTLREAQFYGGDAEAVGLSDARAKTGNLLGRLYRVYDEAGEETFEAYDFAGRVTEKSRRVIADEAILGVFGAMSESGVVKAFRVDWEPRGKTVVQQAAALLDGTAYETSMEYDALGRVRRFLYPKDADHERKELLPSYNRAGALESVTLDKQTYVDRIVYDAKGQRAMIAYGNKVLTRYAYDPRTSRLVRMRTERCERTGTAKAPTYEPRGGVLQDLGYAYDLAGNILRIDDRTPEQTGGPGGLVRRFDYDPIYRLTYADGREADVPLPAQPWDERKTFDVTKTRRYEEYYYYDKAGNIEAISGLPGVPVRRMTLAERNNQLATVEVGQTKYVYSYDVNGNLVREDQTRRFEWDYSDRMRVFQDRSERSKPTVHVHYLYDSGGERVKKLVWKGNTPVETAVYIDGVFERRAEGRKSNDTLHVMDGKQRIALVRVGTALSDEEGTPAVRYQLGDHLGSVNVEVEGQGAWMKREEHTPHGETSFGGHKKKRYRFMGKEREGESGLYYHGARYYAPWVGRWVSCDPIGMADHLNPYIFSRANPINFTDSDGRAPEGVSEKEAALVKAREEQDALVKRLERAETTKRVQEDAIKNRKQDIAQIKSDMKDPTKGDLQKAMRKDLAKNEQALANTEQNLQRTQRELKEIHSQFKELEKRVDRLTREVNKLGGDANLGPGEEKYGVANEQSLAEAEADPLERKFSDLEGHPESPGRLRGGAGPEGPKGPKASVAPEGGGAGRARGAGKALRVAGGVLTAVTIVEHLIEKDYDAVALDVGMEVTCWLAGPEACAIVAIVMLFTGPWPPGKPMNETYYLSSPNAQIPTTRAIGGPLMWEKPQPAGTHMTSDGRILWR